MNIKIPDVEFEEDCYSCKLRHEQYEYKDCKVCNNTRLVISSFGEKLLDFLETYTNIERKPNDS